MCDDITFFMLKFLIACSLEFLLMLLSIFLFFDSFSIPFAKFKGSFTFTIKKFAVYEILLVSSQ